MNELSLPEKVSRVSTDEEATTSANAVTESSSNVVMVESNNTCMLCMFCTISR